MRVLAAAVVLATTEALVRPGSINFSTTHFSRGTRPRTRTLTTMKALRGGGIVKATRAVITRFPLASVGAALAIGVGTGLYAAAPVMDVFERYHTAADIPNTASRITMRSQWSS